MKLGVCAAFLQLLTRLDSNVDGTYIAILDIQPNMTRIVCRLLFRQFDLVPPYSSQNVLTNLANFGFPIIRRFPTFNGIW